jgi:membrane protease YdiL (CAAX protease family)
VFEDLEENESDSPQRERDPQSFVWTALIFYGVMGCAALVWRMIVPGESILHPEGGSAREAWGLLSALGVGALVGLGAVGVSELLTRYTQLGEGLADLLGESLAGIGRADAVLLALASGIAEEMLFRGALQPSVGIFWASLIFGACHFLPRRELMLWSVYAVAMGFAFGGLFEWTGQLAAPIAAHVVVNGINLPRLARRFEESGLEGGDDSEPRSREDGGSGGDLEN